MTKIDYRPPRWLRNPHLQSLLSSLPMRRNAGRRALARIGAQAIGDVIETPQGVRLQGVLNRQGATPGRGLVVLLHGWEGSSESGYMQHTTLALLQAGFDVFRLNFRDHGDSHHLNPDLFHSCRLEEVVQAVAVVQQRHANGPLLLAGFSLGGNFALRVALAAPAAGIDLQHAAAVCPAIDPSAVMRRLETGFPLYHWYFMKKWRRSLLRKRALFPEQHDFDDRVLAQDMRGLTGWLVQRHTRLPDVESYFDGYAVAGDRLAGLQVPVSVLAAADDPVIPFESFAGLRLPAHSRLEIAEFGGHCGFIEGLSLRGFSERWVAARLLEAVQSADRATMGVSASA